MIIFYLFHVAVFPLSTSESKAQGEETEEERGSEETKKGEKKKLIEHGEQR